jgi:Na+-driven multidrug efflux pump
MGPARTYVLIRALGFPVQLLNTAMWGVCLGHKDPKTPLFVSLLSLVLNIIGALLR